MKYMLTNRIDVNKPNSNISDLSTMNYEATNTHEFGDSIGYNEEFEATAVTQDHASDMDYKHFPIGECIFHQIYMLSAQHVI